MLRKNLDRLRNLKRRWFAPPPIDPLQDLVDFMENHTRSSEGRLNLLGWDIEFQNAESAYNMLTNQVLRQGNDFWATTDKPYVIDCGANIGISTLRFKQLYPQAEIVAFEPDKAAFELLKRNMERNHFSDVELVNAAAWVEDTQIDFYMVGGQSGHIDLHHYEPSQNELKVTIQALDLAKYLNRPVDYLKLDIEGAEFAVMKHIQPQLANIRLLIVEAHHWVDKPNQLAEMLSLLSNEGFNIAISAWESEMYFDKPYKRPLETVNADQFPIFHCWRGEV